MRELFTQERVAASANLFLDGLLSAERRKTGWIRAEAAGDPGPWRQQAILGRGRWDADRLRDLVREHVVENLAADDAVLALHRGDHLLAVVRSSHTVRHMHHTSISVMVCQAIWGLTSIA
jgi:hypothetical protein